MAKRESTQGERPRCTSTSWNPENGPAVTRRSKKVGQIRPYKRARHQETLDRISSDGALTRDCVKNAEGCILGAISTVKDMIDSKSQQSSSTAKKAAAKKAVAKKAQRNALPRRQSQRKRQRNGWPRKQRGKKTQVDSKRESEINEFNSRESEINEFNSEFNKEHERVTDEWKEFVQQNPHIPRHEHVERYTALMSALMARWGRSF